MLSSPTHVVIGTDDLAASERFLATFGFQRLAGAVLEAAAAKKLYGYETPCHEVVLAAPDATRGWLRLVATPGRYAPPQPRDPRSLAVVVVTRDLGESLARAAVAGARCGEPVTDAARGVREAVAEGPADLKVLLREAGDGVVPRRSLLHRFPDRLCSEAAGVLWSVQTFSTMQIFWGTSGVGLEVVDTPVAAESAVIAQAAGLERPWEKPEGEPEEDRDKSLDHAQIVNPMEHAPEERRERGGELDEGGGVRPFAAMRVADPLGLPLALELVEFGDPELHHRPTWPLALGIHAVAFEVASVRQELRRIDTAAYGEIAEVDSAVHFRGQGVSLRAPGRVRFELWQETSPIPIAGPVN